MDYDRSLVSLSSSSAALHPKHDIFLSHSGKQKGFVKDLVERLSSIGYSVFFDQNEDSLPPGQRFPDLIFAAAKTCKIAIVVLSDDFFTSRWPMIELCAFAERLQSKQSAGDVSAEPLTILPLFYKLSPEDMKKKVKQWGRVWKMFEKQDGRGRMSADKCEAAVTKHLPALNGIVRKSESEQGDGSYIEEVVKKMQGILPLRVRFTDDNKKYSGTRRLCKIILDKFEELETQHHKFEELETQHPSNSRSNCNVEACILGIHGISGSGKTTLCKLLCDDMHDEFRGNVIYFDLPTKLDPHGNHASTSADCQVLAQQYAKLLPKLTQNIDSPSMDLSKVKDGLKKARFSNKVFLVLDNISPSNQKSYKTMLKYILSLGLLKPGSRMILVAQTHAMLEKLLTEHEVRGYSMYIHDIIETPCLTGGEAMEMMRNCAGYPSMKEDLMTHVLHMLHSSLYIPFVFEQIGVLLREYSYIDAKQLLSHIVSGSMHKLVEMSFQQLPKDLQVLVLDIALFIIPEGHSHLDHAIPILCSMHDLDLISLRMKIKELCEHCALSIVGNQMKWLHIHDIFMEYAKSSTRNSISYVEKSLLQILDCASSSTDHKMVHLKCPEARTIMIGDRMEWESHDKDTIACRDIHLHLEIGAKAKAVLVRNNFHNFMKCSLVLSGDLSSLLCLKMENVESLAILPSAIGVNLPNLVRLDLINEKTKELEISTRSFSSFISHAIQDCKRSLQQWLLMPLSPWQSVARNDYGSLATLGKMASLREMKLINACIRRLENIGQYCPQLEDLEIHDEELMVLNIGRAAKLKRLAIGDMEGKLHLSVKDRFSDEMELEIQPTKASKVVLQLGECPELEQVRMDVRYFDNVEVTGPLPIKLRNFGLANCHKSVEVIPTILISQRTEYNSRVVLLSILERLELVGNQGERLDFTQHCLPSLVFLYIETCPNLTHLSVDPKCLPFLKYLIVSSCKKLCAFDGLESLVKEPLLRTMDLKDLPLLRCHLRFGSDRLQNIKVERCPRVVIYSRFLESSKCLVFICLKETCIATVGKKNQYFGIEDTIMSMGCNSLQYIRLERISLHQRDNNMNIAGLDPHIIMPSNEKEEDGSSMLDYECSDSVASSTSSLHDRVKFCKGQFKSLQNLTLEGVEAMKNLQEIQGIEHLGMLEKLCLTNLPSLTRVSGFWPESIKEICFRECKMLEEVPRFKDTVKDVRHLSCVECPKLKSVDGSFKQQLKCRFVEFVGCKSMEVFPLEDMIDELGQINSKVILVVRSCKFASVGVMRGWLCMSQLGSRLFEAAILCLMWEYVKKDALDARDSLFDYFSAALSPSQNIISNNRSYIMSYLKGRLYPSEFRYSLFFGHLKEEEISFFKNWQFLYAEIHA